MLTVNSIWCYSCLSSHSRKIHVQVNTSVYSLIKSIMEFNNNNYSAAFIGPCNALGLGEFEETIRPCSFTIGSENKNTT